MHPHQPADLWRRIDALESRLRRTRAALFGACILALAGGLIAAKAPPKPVFASAFVLVDESGATRGQLAVTPDGAASFFLKGAGATGDAGFVVSPSGASALRLRTPRRSVAIEAADDGRAELRILDRRAKGAASVSIGATGAPRILLNDARGKVVFDSKTP